VIHLCRYHKAVTRIERGLPPNKLVPKLRANVDEFRTLLPVVAAMRNSALKDRHWAKVFASIGSVLTRDENFTLQVRPSRHAGYWTNEERNSHHMQDNPILQTPNPLLAQKCVASCVLTPAQLRRHLSSRCSVADYAINQQVLLDAKVGAVKDAIIATSTEATQEAALEDLLAKVVTKWATIELAVVPYKDSKDVYILGSIENVQVRHTPFKLPVSCSQALRVPYLLSGWGRQVTCAPTRAVCLMLEVVP
jgi:hypothetical protein